MQQMLVEKVVTGILIIFLLGCSSAPAVKGDRADEQRANAEKAHKELSQEVKKTK
jgi:PBP1b-binding outer membrane lipoprotein LpoB